MQVPNAAESGNRSKRVSLADLPGGKEAAPPAPREEAAPHGEAASLTANAVGDESLGAASGDNQSGRSARRHSALFRKRFDWVFFQLTQHLLLVTLLCSAGIVLFGEVLNPAGSVPATALLVWKSVALLLDVATVAPQVYFLLAEREQPTWWMWFDFSLAGLILVIDVVFIAVAALGGSQLGRNSFYGLLVLTMLAHAVRLYVRHAIYADVAHARWHELKVGKSAPHISSLAITYRACEVLVHEAPWTHVGYLLCTVASASRGPLISLVVSIAIGTPPAALRLGPVIGALVGVILFGVAGGAGMSVLTARAFAIGSKALQRRLALKAIYGAANKNTGLLTSTFSQGLSKLQSLWLAVYWTLIFNVIALLLNLVFLATVDVVLAAVTLSLLAAVFTLPVGKGKSGKASVTYAARLGEQQAVLENLIALQTSARTNRAGWWLMRRWDVLGERTRGALYTSQVSSNFISVGIAAASYVAYLLCVSAIFARYQAGLLSQQQAFAATGYLIGIIAPNIALGGFSSRVIWTAGPVLSVFSMAGEDFTEDHELPRCPGVGAGGSVPAPAPSPPLRAPSNAPAVVARDVVFTYPSSAGPTLKSLSAEVRPGEYVALCGGSGSGKTTLLRLMGRANTSRSDADSGSITVDGVAADDYTGTAFCTQSFEVLNGTVRDNISFSSEWDSDDDVRAAARLAELAHVIESMPDGYDTVIGRGSTVALSGGQLARLGLARALCRRPRLLLLDEITSPLDPEVSCQRDETRRGETRYETSRPRSRLDTTRHNLTRHDSTRHDSTRLDWTRLDGAPSRRDQGR
jgi:ABC-type multidrug transport system fused ATPase/permease subunit